MTTCERAQAAISAQMDGERLSAGTRGLVDEHAGSCARCRAFRDRSFRLRTAVRIRPAEPVPDLTDRIVAALREEASRRPRRVRWPPFRTRPSRLAPVAASLVVGLLLGSLTVGGPWQPPAGRPIAAATVVRGVRAAAANLDAYRASFAIVEQGLSNVVPERDLSMNVAFRSPGRFRLDLRDQTAYPSSAWTPTNLTYIADGTSRYRSGPTGCPGDLPPSVCPPTRAVVTHSARFDPGAPLPADLVLPLTTLSSAHGVRVLGTGTALGREVVRVELPFDRAAPLFPFLQLGGTWRPFFADDRVVVELDRDDWFPLRLTMYPSSSPERRTWELRFGLPVESPRQAILDVRATSFETTSPGASLFGFPGRPARSVPISVLPGKVGYVPITPTQPSDLRLTSAVVPPKDDANAPTSLLTYTRGLTYLEVAEHPGWQGPGPFGPADPQAAEVTLPGVGVAYFDPAMTGRGSVLAVHAASTDLFLESNLPRARLFSIASSLPVRGEPLPPAWRSVIGAGLGSARVSLAEARRIVAFPIELPTWLPMGYRLASAEVGTDGATAVTLYFQGDAAVDAPIRLHLEARSALPGASSAEQVLVELGGVHARWTASRDELERIDHGLYRSIDGAGLDLPTALRIAASIPKGGQGG